jgi:antitoxin YefM
MFYCTSFCTVTLMETLPLSDVRSTLSSIVERVEGTHERVLVTRNGRPAAVLISPEDLEGLEETLDVLSDPVVMAQLREGEAAVAAGDVIDEVGLRELVAKRAR